jgi:asparagine synthase (glutamine-hydrolysing)
MCGLVGIAGGNPHRAEIGSMLDQIRHRGPDGDGCSFAPGLGVGHVRLAIIDPSPAGAQPMLSPDGRYLLVYNGELYNHLDFRSDLESRGVQFRGHSDTETLLWLLIIHGEAILDKLNGIFAFAFNDRETRTLILARDQLGVKPLYYARGRDGRLLFASEIKALFATGEVAPRLNVDDALELFMFHFVAGERTAFAGVSELLPGHVLTYREGHSTTRAYWDLVDDARIRNGHRADSAKVIQLLEDAVERQLMSDVPVGIMCSGGLDSGILTAMAGRADKPLVGFCFRDSVYGYDEFAQARDLGRTFGIDVEGVCLAEQAVPDLLWSLAWHHDEPLPRPHHVAAYAVSRAARARGLKVLISGEGGDELFGGYARYAELGDVMSLSGDLSPLVFAHNGVAVPRIKRFWSRPDFNNGYRAWCADQTRGLDIINRQLLVDQRTFLQHFLQRSDRMGMAAGVEIRVPLLDMRVVSHINRLPGEEKIAGAETKLCLKRAARHILPPAVLQRPKRGFEMPMAPLLSHGPVAELADDLLLSRPRCGEIFDANGIAGVLHDLRAGQEDLWKVAWLLLTTELWMRTFKVTV